MTWVEKHNGVRLDTIHFVAFVNAGPGREVRHRFGVANPPAYEGHPDLFERLSFEVIREQFAEWGYPRVKYVIRGESGETWVRDSYVYDGTHRVPFATIRPEVFVRA